MPSGLGFCCPNNSRTSFLTFFSCQSPRIASSKTVQASALVVAARQSRQAHLSSSIVLQCKSSCSHQSSHLLLSNSSYQHCERSSLVVQENHLHNHPFSLSLSPPSFLYHLYNAVSLALAKFLCFNIILCLKVYSAIIESGRCKTLNK